MIRISCHDLDCAHPASNSLSSAQYRISVGLAWAEVPAGSPSRGGDAAVYVIDIKQPGLPAAFYSVLASISVFRALSFVFHSRDYPVNSLLSHSVLPVLSLPYWSFQLYIYLLKTVSLSPVLFCCDHQSISTRLVQCTESMLAWVVNEVCLYY